MSICGVAEELRPPKNRRLIIAYAVAIPVGVALWWIASPAHHSATVAANYQTTQSHLSAGLVLNGILGGLASATLATLLVKSGFRLWVPFIYLLGFGLDFWSSGTIGATLLVHRTTPYWLAYIAWIALLTAPAMIFGATSSIEERRRPSVLTIVPAVIVAMALVMSAHHFDTYGDKVPHAFALMVWFAAPDLKYLIFGFLVGIRRPIWPKLIALPGLLATAAGIWWTLAVYHLNLQVILYAVTPLAFTYLAAATWFFPSRARQRRQPEQRLENA